MNYLVVDRSRIEAIGVTAFSMQHPRLARLFTDRINAIPPFAPFNSDFILCLQNPGASARKWTTPLNAADWIPPETTPAMALSSSLPLNPPPTNSPQAPTTKRHAGAPAGPSRRPIRQSARIRGRAASPAQKVRTSWLWTRRSTGARRAGIAGVAVPVRYKTRT